MKYDKAKLIEKLRAKQQHLRTEIEKDKVAIAAARIQQEEAFDTALKLHLDAVKRYWKEMRKLTGKEYYKKMPCLPQFHSFYVPSSSWTDRNDKPRQVAHIDTLIAQLELVAGNAVSLGQGYEFDQIWKYIQ